MKNRKRAAALILAALTVLILLCSCGRKKTSDIPDPTDAFYVYDAAEVLDSDTEEYIIGKNADLYKKCGGQIVVACINTTGAADIKDYAADMFNKWGIGSSSRNNGILILLSIGEDDYWVLQGEGLEDLIQSGTLKLMLDTDLEPFFAKKQYADGVRTLFDSLIAEFEQIYSISVAQLSINSVGSYTPEEADTAAAESGKFSLWTLIKTVSGIVVAVAVEVIIIVIIITIAVTVFIIIASVFSSGGGVRPPRSTFRGGININPHTFRPRNTYHGGNFNFGGTHHSGGFNFGGSHHSGGSFGGSHGGFSGGSHHSGGGGFSRGGGAGRR